MTESASPADQSSLPELTASPGTDSAITRRDVLKSCVHCGLCLEVCPTYQLSGDENNSPRGRLRLWREEADGRIPADPWTATYTDECVGCLACESACPANVPYGEILEHSRQEQLSAGRTRIPVSIRTAAALAARPRLFSLVMTPIRLLRKLGWLSHRFVFSGTPSTTLSTAAYAQQLMQRHRPTGPRVALLTGCLMEAVFREINFATVRVLIRNNIQVFVPAAQGCCGALHEHLGLNHAAALRRQNQAAFQPADADLILTNSSGCGLALRKALADRMPVQDVLQFLGELNPIAPSSRRSATARVYVDLPCHLIHGQKTPGIPESVLNATGYAWQLAPQAQDCCGSGGVYNLRKPENAQEMLKRKAEFLNHADGDPVILATSNHVCMMQWHSAASGIVTRPYLVKHLIQLLDDEPGDR